MVTGKMQATINPIQGKGVGMISNVPSIIWALLTFAFWAGGVIVLFSSAKRWSWPFKWPWGKISLKEASQNLYNKLIISNMTNNFKRLLVDPYESHDEVLNVLAEHLANENITMYGKPRFSTKMIEIKNLQIKLGNMEFRDGATSLCYFGKDMPKEVTDLFVKKSEARKAIENIMIKMPDLLT